MKLTRYLRSVALLQIFQIRTQVVFSTKQQHCRECEMMLRVAQANRLIYSSADLREQILKVMNET